MRDLVNFINQHTKFSKNKLTYRVYSNSDLVLYLYLWLQDTDMKNAEFHEEGYDEDSKSYRPFVEFGSKNALNDFKGFYDKYSERFVSERGHLIPELPMSGMYSIIVVPTDIDIEIENDEIAIWKQWKDIVYEAKNPVYGLRSVVEIKGKIEYYIKAWIFTNEEDAVAFKLRK